MPRPSMRTPSSTIRLRTSFLVRERTAEDISFSLPANSSDSSSISEAAVSDSAASRSDLSEMVVTLPIRSDPEGFNALEDLRRVVAGGVRRRAAHANRPRPAARAGAQPTP